MEFVWDEAKRGSNLAKHGLDFADAHLVYDSPSKVTFRTERRDEPRMVDIAMVTVLGRVLLLAYMEREGTIRIISFRIAHRNERRAYEAARWPE